MGKGEKADTEKKDRKEGYDLKEKRRKKMTRILINNAGLYVLNAGREGTFVQTVPIIRIVEIRFII